MNLGCILKSDLFPNTINSKPVEEAANLFICVRIGGECYFRMLQNECVERSSSIGEEAVFAVFGGGQAAYALGFCELLEPFSHDSCARGLCQAKTRHLKGIHSAPGTAL